LSDYAKSDKKKFESLRQNKVLEGERLLNFAAILGLQEADIEDVFTPGSELKSSTELSIFPLRIRRRRKP
jgi:hypothetical protein